MLPFCLPAECQTLIQFWDVGKVQSVDVPAMGTINTIRIVTTDRGKYVLRIYRHKDRVRIEREHRVVSWIKEKGLPAVVPINTKNHATFLEYDNNLITLLPFIKDRQTSRDRLSSTDIEAMGQCLGKLHNTLESCPSTNIPPVQIKLDRNHTLTNASRLEKIVRSIKTPEPTDTYALHRLQTRQAWLKNRSDDDTSTLHALPFHVVHGDYQETNVFFKNNAVSAIIDWDKIYIAPGAWEVIRTLHLMLHFHPERSQIFLTAYRKSRDLTSTDLDIAAHAYGLMRAYDLWLFEEIYDTGNNRVRKFLNPGPFTPVAHDWQHLRAYL